MVRNFNRLKINRESIHFPSANLLVWYDQEKRDLPWRKTSDPYRIWISEIILQQTRVDQGLPYYHRFLSKFKTVFDLAKATEDEVLKTWEGLGYYSRARNLHFTAKYVVSELNGLFPRDYEGLLALKGVGPYTAAAIGSIAYGLPTAVVDGNVYRVLARFFGIQTSIDETPTQKQIAGLAQEILDKGRPADFNQAVMELGATICTPTGPNCGNCPLRGGCVAVQTNNQACLPIRSKKIKVRTRYFYYLVLFYKGETQVRRRPAGDIWQGLYEFPLIESDASLSDEEILIACNLNSDDVVKSVSDEYVHILSHQRIIARFILVERKKLKNSNYITSAVNKLSSFAFPRLINRYLEKQNFVID